VCRRSDPPPQRNAHLCRTRIPIRPLTCIKPRFSTKCPPNKIGFYNYHRRAVDPREFLTTALTDCLRATGELTIERMAALASSVVASMPIRRPRSNPRFAGRFNTQPKTSGCVSTSIRRRVSSSGLSLQSAAAPTNPPNAKRSHARYRYPRNSRSAATGSH
jgi:hypothetical protein